MARIADDGRTWARAEAVDTLGRMPGRRRRVLGSALGLAAIGAGVYLGFGPAAAGPSTAVFDPGPAVATCATLGINLAVGSYPAEGIAQSSVIRLWRADRDGTAQLLLPQSFVLASVPLQDGSVNLSILVRTGVGEGDQVVDDVNGANAERALSAALLYDVDNVAVLDECRGGQ